MVAKIGRFLFIAVLSLAALGCGSKEETNGRTETAQTTEPDRVTAQHILIGFTGSIPGKAIERTTEEARALAEDILRRARAGEDFDKLVKEYTDDRHPGIYKMTNTGIPDDPANNIYERTGMVRGFGDVGFSLAVGEIGMAPYDPQTSPYGWHVIKRLE